MTIKKFKKLFTMYVLAIVLSTTGCGKSENKGFAETLEENQDNTCLDEVIKSKQSNLLEQVNKLKEYIDLSNELNNYNIPKMYISEDVLNESKLFSVDEINQLYDDFKQDEMTENYDELLNELNIQVILVNNFIKDEGYKISSGLTLLTLKTKIAESYGLPSINYTVGLVDKFQLPSYKDFNAGENSCDTFKIGSKEIKILYDYKKMLNDIHELQNCIGRASGGYNKERNEMISNAINSAEKMLPKSYTLKFKK